MIPDDDDPVDPLGYNTTIRIISVKWREMRSKAVIKMQSKPSSPPSSERWDGCHGNFRAGAR